MENINVVERSNAMGPEKRIPAVMYGRSTGSRSIFVLAGQHRAKAWHEGNKFTLDFDGQTFKGTLEEVQTDAVGTMVKHLSFHVVGQDEITRVEVPVHVTHATGQKGVISQMLNHVPLKGKLTDLPEQLDVDASKLQINESIHLNEVTLPPGVEFAFGNDVNLEDYAVVVCKPANAATSGTAENEGAEDPTNTPAENGNTEE